MMVSMKRIKALDVSVLLVPIVLYLGLVWHSIGKWSIWFDEAFSAYLMRYSLTDIFHYTAADVHPPFYYVLLKFWTSIFGTSDVALRSMSALCIAAAIVVAYFFVKSVFGRKVAFGAAMVLAMSPMLVRFGQEARMYGLVVLIAVAATWVLYSIHLRPTRNKWIAYAVLVALGMWTHYFTALVWLAHWVWRSFVIAGRGTKATFRSRFFTRSWVKTHALAIALFLPWLPFMAMQLGHIQGNGFWIRAVDADTMTDFVTSNLLFLEHYEATSWLAVFCIVTAVLGAYLGKRVYQTLLPHQKWAFSLVAAVALASPVLLFIASLPPLRPSFVDRYLLSSCFWLMALLGMIVVLSFRRHRVASITLGVVIAIALVVGLGNVYRLGNFNRESWETMAMKDVIHMINIRDTSESPIIADSPWRFYEAIQYDTPQHNVYFINEWSPYGSYNMLRDRAYRKIHDTQWFYGQHKEFWYVGVYHDSNPHMPAGNWQVIDSVQGPQTLEGSGTIYGYKLRAQ